jgi:hypothetical protein
MKQSELDKHIWEGWRVSDFIDELKAEVAAIMTGRSWKQPFSNKRELAAWCADNQPYYKKQIPGVVKYFAEMYNIK